MQHRISFLVVLVSFALLVACANQTSTSGPHAMVYLRDGSTFSGGVVKTSASEITIVGDDQSTRTIPMQNVKTIDYGDAAPPPAGSTAPPPAVVTAPPPAEPVRERSHEDHYHPEESSIRTRTYQVPAGTEIAVRTEETIDSGRAAEGQSYAAEVTRDVPDANGDVVVPRGSNAQMVIRSASQGGRFRGTSDMVLDLTSVSVDGRQYQLSAGTVEDRGKAGLGKNERTAKFVGGGALLGTVIGAIAGHGKGAAIGAASGAAAGAATQLITRGGGIHVPAETILTFRLDRPLRVAAAR